MMIDGAVEITGVFGNLLEEIMEHDMFRKVIFIKRLCVLISTNICFPCNNTQGVKKITTKCNAANIQASYTLNNT